MPGVLDVLNRDRLAQGPHPCWLPMFDGYRLETFDVRC